MKKRTKERIERTKDWIENALNALSLILAFLK